MLRKAFAIYFVACGIFTHVLAIGWILSEPQRARYLATTGVELVRARLDAAGPKPKQLTAPDIGRLLPDYVPAAAGALAPGAIRIGEQRFVSLTEAAKHLVDGDILRIGPGVYAEAMTVRANNVRIIGEGHVIIENAAANGKGAVLVQGNSTSISHIECRYIQVPHNNGACVRLEGTDLELDHVYFHDSQSGLLAGGDHHGLITIRDSRFENLGAAAGQTHAIYVGGDDLVIHSSQFLRTRNEGHGVKSRTRRTRIFDSVLASLDSQDSRLLDIPNGGTLVVSNSVLAQGPASANRDLVGFGLEGLIHKNSSIKVEFNVILLERTGGNVLIHAIDGVPPPNVHNNVIVGDDLEKYAMSNIVFATRQEAGIPPYPALPVPPGAATP